MANPKDDHIVICVDMSENSLRAVTYAARMVSVVPGLKAALLHVIHALDEDFFPSPKERDRWCRAARTKVDARMHAYRQLMITAGCPPDNVEIRIVERDGPSLASLILTELDRLNAGTVVLGRQGLSRKEEFLFGSVSRQIVSHIRDCTVWVVQ
jgi:nucleotide-binding universal stress UspA family protein